MLYWESVIGIETVSPATRAFPTSVEHKRQTILSEATGAPLTAPIQKVQKKEESEDWHESYL